MKLSVIGCGYLGAVHAASMAERGQQVLGVEVGPGNIQQRRAGRAPVVEPGRAEGRAAAPAAGRLRVSTHIPGAPEAPRHVVAGVRLDEVVTELISCLCRQNHVAGHRADIVMAEATRAHAALVGRGVATEDDVLTISEMVLRHRRRVETPSESPPPRNQHPDDQPDQPEQRPREPERPDPDVEK